MLIVTKQGEKILFDRLDDLRGYVDDNILDGLKEFINNEITNALDNKDIEDYKAEIDDLKDDLEVRDRIEDEAKSEIENIIEKLNEIKESLDNWL